MGLRDMRWGEAVTEARPPLDLDALERKYAGLSPDAEALIAEVRSLRERHHKCDHVDEVLHLERERRQSLEARIAKYEKVVEASGTYVQHINEGSECPDCGTTDDHESDCRIGAIYDALAALDDTRGTTPVTSKEADQCHVLT